jgi:hypothetical protein
MKTIVYIFTIFLIFFSSGTMQLEARLLHRPASEISKTAPQALEIPKNLRDVQRIWEHEFKKHDWSELATRAQGHYQQDKFAELESLQNAYQLLFCRLSDLCGLPEADAAKHAKTYVEMLQENIDSMMAYEVATEGVCFPSLVPKQPVASPIGRHRPGPGSSAPKPRIQFPKPYAAVEERDDIIQYRHNTQYMLSEIGNNYRAISAVAQAVQHRVPQVRGMQNLTESIVIEAAYQQCGSLDNKIAHLTFDELRDKSIELLKKVWNEIVKKKRDCASVFEVSCENNLGSLCRSEAFSDSEHRSRLHALRVVLKRISDHLTPVQRALILHR